MLTMIYSLPALKYYINNLYSFFFETTAHKACVCLNSANDSLKIHFFQGLFVIH